MNVIELCGGIGNQMFQYAFGRVQKERGIDVSYSLRWYRFPQVPPRPYRLDKFNMKIPIVYKDILNQKTVKESLPFIYEPTCLENENCNIHGYWQFLDYFKHILPILRKEFKVPEQHHTNEFKELLKEVEVLPNSVSLHVRRGDYIGRAGFGILPITYYIDSLKIIEKKCKKIDTVYIFSDDIDWCRGFFKTEYFGYKFKIVDFPEDYLCMELMKSCVHNIISNSTFGWWAAILNTSNGIVVRPSGWLSNTGVGEREGNALKHWIQIKTV